MNSNIQSFLGSSGVNIPFPTASLDKAWDTFFDTPQFSRLKGLSYEIKSDSGSVIAEVEVPGVDPNDVNVRVEGRALHVETPRGNAYFTVGSRVDQENVTATLKHGLLIIRIPKREARKIDVAVNVEE